MQKIHPCLWFDNQAEEAAKLYTSLFPKSKIGRTVRYGKSASEVSRQREGTVMTVEFELAGQSILGLNGGPLFKFTPAFSLFVRCETEAEIDSLWKSLSAGGEVRMGLDKYPWAPKYGWTADRFGLEWQLILADGNQKIAPAFLFVKELFGKGEKAIRFYTSLFDDSRIGALSRDPATSTIQHGTFTLAGQEFVLMEGQGPHDFGFSTAFSLVVNCDSQAEIDRYYDELVQGGTPQPCGWLEDRYGVSWQIQPAKMGDWMSEPKKAEAVMKAILEMKKIDLEKVRQAYERG